MQHKRLLWQENGQARLCSLTQPWKDASLHILKQIALEHNVILDITFKYDFWEQPTVNQSEVHSVLSHKNPDIAWHSYDLVENFWNETVIPIRYTTERESFFRGCALLFSRGLGMDRLTEEYDYIIMYRSDLIMNPDRETMEWLWVTLTQDSSEYVHDYLYYHKVFTSRIWYTPGDGLMIKDQMLLSDRHGRRSMFYNWKEKFTNWLMTTPAPTCSPHVMNGCLVSSEITHESFFEANKNRLDTNYTAIPMLYPDTYIIFFHHLVREHHEQLLRLPPSPEVYERIINFPA